MQFTVRLITTVFELKTCWQDKTGRSMTAMNILVATVRTQGQRASDFNFAAEGEIVVLDDEHDGETIDGYCGCQRSLVGVESGMGTTTFEVIEANYDRQEFLEMIRAAREDYEAMGVGDDNISAEADHLLELAARFTVGSVIEKRGDVFQVREA